MNQEALTFFIACLLLTIAIVDIDTMEVPNGLIFILGIAALASVWIFPEITLMQRCVGAFCVSVPMYLLCLIVDGAFGGADIKLLAVMGFYLGWRAILTATFIGFMIGGIQGIVLLASGKVKRGEGAHMAFCPALCAGIFLAQLYGEEIFSWYIGLIL